MKEIKDATFEDLVRNQLETMAKKYDEMFDQLQDEKEKAIEKAYSDGIKAGAKVQRSFVDELIIPPWN